MAADEKLRSLCEWLGRNESDDRPTYDPRVFDLACLFLSEFPEIDNERNRHDLASHIAGQITDWIEYYPKEQK